MPIITELNREGRRVAVPPRRRPHVNTRAAMRFAPAGHPPPEPPPAFDLRARCRPIRCQDPIASCTAHAFTAALEFLHDEELGERRLSPLFTYWTSRVELAGVQPDEDAGCTHEDVARSLETYGACLDELWAYRPENFDNRPPHAAFADGENRRVPVALPLDTLRSVKLCLAQGFPVAVLFALARSVKNGENGRACRTWDTGVFPLPIDDDPANYARFEGEHALRPDPSAPDHAVGNHAVLAVGYDDDKQVVYVANSWGDAFGLGGYGSLAYTFFGPQQDADLQSHTAPCMAFDAWTLRRERDAFNPVPR